MKGIWITEGDPGTALERTAEHSISAADSGLSSKIII